VGVWYGLRIAKDGKGRGFPIPVFGGLHGDLPLDPKAGALVADIIVDRNISAVVDISQMESDAEAGRFATEFAKRLFDRRKARPAVTVLFLEECQEFIPENPVGGAENQKLHKFTRMAKIGRNFGIAMGLISQRPQEISKKCLNLSECVFAFQMNGSQERDAIKKWLRDSGAGVDLKVDDLPTLEVGTAHVWSPRWLKVSRDIQFLPKATFDSSGTPDHKASKAVEVKPLGAEDLDAIRASMADIIEKSKAEDPRELQKKIADLERELKKSISRPGHAVKAQSDITVADLDNRYRAGWMQGYDASRKQALEFNARAGEKIHAIINGYADTKPLAAPRSPIAAKELPKTSGGPHSFTPPVPRATQAPRADTNGHGRIAADQSVGKSGLYRMMVSLAQVPEGLSDSKLGLRAKVSVKGGSFDTYLSRGRKSGWIEGDRKRLVITAAGREALGHYEELPTGDDLRNYWVSKFGSSGAARMLSELIRAYPDSLTAEELGEKSEISVTGGSFDTYLSRLRGFDLITGSRSDLRANEGLFT
jgi:hypothetical protein